MANTDRPRGASPIRHLNGAYCGQFHEYAVDASNTPACFVGDFIAMEADGNVGPAVAGTTKIILGVMVGRLPNYGDLTLNYLPVSTAGSIWVCDDPDVIFECQEVSSGTALAATDVGMNTPIVIGAGSTTTGISGHEINNAGEVATIEQIRLLRLVPRADNAYGVSADWEIRINEHFFHDVGNVGI